MTSASQALTGFFGKLPALGDFVCRRLPGDFTEPWDAWLRAGVAQSKDDLGDAWLDIYLTSPFWRFSLAPGLCGAELATGVLTPSVDAVNRHYPLVFAAIMPTSCNLFALAASADGWFAALEELATTVLQRRLETASVEISLDEIGLPEVPVEGNDLRLKGLSDLSANSIRWQMELQGEAILAQNLFPALLDRMTRSAMGPYSLWWTAGSDRIPPSLMIYSGLPPAVDFSAMLGSPTLSARSPAGLSEDATAVGPEVAR